MRRLVLATLCAVLSTAAQARGPAHGTLEGKMNVQVRIVAASTTAPKASGPNVCANALQRWRASGEPKSALPDYLVGTGCQTTFATR